MFKKLLLVGVVAGIASGVASIIYAQVYHAAFGVDFSAVVNPVGMLSSCLFGSVLASVGYWGLFKVVSKWAQVVFNLVFILLSFASIIFPLVATLPYDIEFPELFPGFAIPMHFFPALFWFGLKPMVFREVINKEL